jgi:lambda family phage tail tape measure protein
MRLLHLKAGSAARVSGSAASGRLRAAVASQINRNITDQGDILASEGRLSAENATLSGLLQDKPAFEKAAAKTLILDYTESLRQQNEELTKELRLSKERIGLQMEGYTEAYIELQLKLNENAREQNKLRIDALTADKAQAAAIKDNLEQYRKQADLLREIYNLQEGAKQGFGFREGARQYVESIGSMKEATAQLTTSGIKGLEESLFSLATTGTANFNQFASELLKQTARIILQQLVLKPLIQGLTSLFGGPATAASGVGSLGPAALNFGPIGPGISAFSANGNAFAANGIVPYAMGGIVQSPTLFRYANGGVPGTGLMGEAGPEAIIPLQRGRNGKLGVAGGGGTTNITVNVDASGTSANNDPGQAAALGRVISQAVQAELVKQKRPGGILSR